MGIHCVDAITGKVLLNQNADKYFTPASNTKILTLYAALKYLPREIPVAYYYYEKDNLYLYPLGDPTQLHPSFQDSTLIDIIGNADTTYIFFNHWQDKRFGPGWAWEDYDQSFSPERSALPLYGNVVYLDTTISQKVIPHLFQNQTYFIDTVINRSEFENVFYFENFADSPHPTPFITSKETILNLLNQVTGKSVQITNSFNYDKRMLLHGMESDSLYRKMMWDSDNFLAEQMLLMVAGIISDTLDSQKAIRSSLDSLTSYLPYPPRWVDGSGLSRYNLIAPSTLTLILRKMYWAEDQEKLFSFFPRGNHRGTIKDLFGPNLGPAVYAKSGTLGNNYNLSGYLLTKSGKVVVFSMMHNHFRRSIAEIKELIKKYLKQIWLTY